MQVQVNVHGPRNGTDPEESKPFFGSNGYSSQGHQRPYAPSAPPPTSPGPPPPGHHPNLQRHRSMRERWHEVEEKMGDSRSTSLIWIAAGSLLLTIAAGGSAFACLTQTEYCPIHKGGWIAGAAVAVYATNVLLGLIAGSKTTFNRATAHLIFSVLAFVLSGLLAAFSLRYWLDIGIYPYGSKAIHCVIDAYDPARMEYVYRHQQQFDFKKCLVEVKVGLSSNAILIFIGLAQGLLNFFCAVICCVRLCTVCKSRSN